MPCYELKQQGETLNFIKDRTNPTDEKVEVEVSLAPGAKGPELHFHLKQDEHFKVISGEMLATIDGKEVRVQAGETVVVKAGQSHGFNNGKSDERLEMFVWFSPALHLQWMLGELAASAIRNGGSWDKIDKIEASYILWQVRDEYRLDGIPFWLQDIMFSSLYVLAILTGKAKNVSSKF